MTPIICAGPSRPFEYDRCDGTKPDGFLESTLQAYEIRELTERELGQFLAEIVLKRVGTPEDVANVVLFLASDMSRHITGARREKNPA